MKKTYKTITKVWLFINIWFTIHSVNRTFTLMLVWCFQHFDANTFGARNILSFNYFVLNFTQFYSKLTLFYTKNIFFCNFFEFVIFFSTSALCKQMNQSEYKRKLLDKLKKDQFIIIKLSSKHKIAASQFVVKILQRCSIIIRQRHLRQICAKSRKIPASRTSGASKLTVI